MPDLSGWHTGKIEEWHSFWGFGTLSSDRSITRFQIERIAFVDSVDTKSDLKGKLVSFNVLSYGSIWWPGGYSHHIYDIRLIPDRRDDELQMWH